MLTSHAAPRCAQHTHPLFSEALPPRRRFGHDVRGQAESFDRASLAERYLDAALQVQRDDDAAEEDDFGGNDDFERKFPPQD